MSLKIFFLLFSLLISLYAASEIETHEVFGFFDFLESDSTSSANAPLVNESFMDFLTDHVNSSFKDSELSTPFRSVLTMMHRNVQDYSELLTLLKDGYKRASSVSPFHRWSVAFNHALNRLASSDPDALEDIMNNHIIHNHPLKEYFQTFKVRQLRDYESVSEYLENMEMSIFKAEMFFLLNGEEINDVKFSPNQLKVLTFLSKFSKAVSWMDSSFPYHFTFIIRCIIDAPLLSLTTLQRQLRNSSIPAFENIAKSLYTEISSNSRDDLVKILKHFTKENMVHQLSYSELIRYAVGNRTNFELISPDFFIGLLDKVLVNPPQEIKGMDSCLSIVKDRVVKMDESQLNETFFWVFYGRYANWITLEKIKAKKYWISAIYSLVAEVSETGIAGNTFEQLLVEMSNLHYNQPTLKLLSNSIGYGHIPTVKLLIAKLRSEITLEIGDNLLLEAAENNGNGVGEFLISESDLIFSYRALQQAKSAADANGSEKLSTLLRAKIELIEGASHDNLFEEDTIVDPFEEQIVDFSEASAGITGNLLPNVSTIAEQHTTMDIDPVLSAAVDDSCSNNDDSLILSLIELTEYDHISSAETEDAFKKLARAGRIDPVLAIATTWMSKLSPWFRRNVMVTAVDRFPDDIFLALFAFDELKPSNEDIEAIFVESIPNRSLVVLHSILKHWLPYISFNAADHALSVAVSFDLLDKVDALVHSDLPITEKGAFNALSLSIEKYHFLIFEFLLSDSNPIEYDENEVAIAMVMAEDNGYTPTKRRKF